MRGRDGRFEAARGGDIFLDEIGDLPLTIQVKLLRVLEEKVIERVGDNRSTPVDVRTITATNRNLRKKDRRQAVKGHGNLGRFSDHGLQLDETVRDHRPRKDQQLICGIKID